MAELNNWGADLSGALAGDIIIYDGSKYVRFNPEKHEFYQRDIATSGVDVSSGTGATVTVGGLANYYMVENIKTGTTTTGYAATSFNRLFIPSAAKIVISFTIRTPPDLSDATDEYEVNVGNWEGVITAPTDGYYFKYLRTANTNWLCSTIDSSSETATDSGVVVAAATIYNMRMEYNSAVPNVKFYLDNVLVATNTTNITTNGSTFVRIICKKSAGTNDRNLKNIGLNIMIIRD